MEQGSTTRKEIFDKLSQISSEGLKEDKFGNVEFVNWMAAHTTMMEHYPEYTWEFIKDSQDREVHYFEGGSAEVRLKMTVEGNVIYTSLPIYFKMKGVIQPDSFQINTAKQRCRVKALAEFGLFQEMWSKLATSEEGEIRQEEAKEPPKKKTNSKPERQSKKKDPEPKQKQTLQELYGQHKPEMVKAKDAKEAGKTWAKFLGNAKNHQIQYSEADEKAVKNLYAIDGGFK